MDCHKVVELLLDISGLDDGFGLVKKGIGFSMVSCGGMNALVMPSKIKRIVITIMRYSELRNNI